MYKWQCYNMQLSPGYVAHYVEIDIFLTISYKIFLLKSHEEMQSLNKWTCYYVKNMRWTA